MNYELRAVRFDYSCSIFGAEHMRQVSPLETRREKRHCTKTEFEPKKKGEIETKSDRISVYHFQCRDGSKVWSSSIALKG